MSKASEWTKRQPKELRLTVPASPRGIKVSYLAFVDESGGLRLDNAGPFPKREALKFARWILDTFKEEK